MSEYRPPSQEWLEDEAERVYKIVNPREYRQEKAAGHLPEYRSLSASNCREYAEAMIRQGLDSEKAWKVAVRETLQRSEMD